MRKYFVSLLFFISFIFSYAQDRVHFLTENGFTVSRTNAQRLALADPLAFGYDIITTDNTTGAASSLTNFHDKLESADNGIMDMAIAVNRQNFLYYIGRDVNNFGVFNLSSANTTPTFNAASKAVVLSNIPFTLSNPLSMGIDNNNKGWLVDYAAQTDANGNITGFLNTVYSFQTNETGGATAFTQGGQIQTTDLAQFTIQDVAFDFNNNMFLLVATDDVQSSVAVNYYIYIITQDKLGALSSGSNVTMERRWQIADAQGTPITSNVYYAGEGITAVSGLAFSSSGRLYVSYSDIVYDADATINQYIGTLSPSGTTATLSQHEVYDQASNFSNNILASDLATNILPIALPVTFGAVTAEISNNKLQVQWTTEAERNNSFFEIQLSADGENFKTIGKIISRAKDGNSSLPLHYNFQTDYTTNSLAGLGIAGILLISLLIQRRNKMLMYTLLTMLGISLLGYSCQKTNEQPGYNDQDKLFIKIKQVDKNGDATYSKNVSVVIK